MISWTNIFDYGFWLTIVIFLGFIAFPEFQFDFFHLVPTIVVAWLLASLFVLKRFTTIQVNFNDNRNAIHLLSKRFPDNYIEKIGSKTCVIERNYGLFFGRRKITILIEKDRFRINISTLLGGVDIPSVFHAIGNFKRAKKLGHELLELSKNIAANK